MHDLSHPWKKETFHRLINNKAQLHMEMTFKQKDKQGYGRSGSRLNKKVVFWIFLPAFSVAQCLEMSRHDLSKLFLYGWPPVYKAYQT